MIHNDQLNRKLQIKSKPKRIVSLVPSQTELLVDLGLENSIVGITKFCIHPEYLRNEKTIVGGTKQIYFEKIKALQPDIILCNKEENTKEIIGQLESLAPIHISDIYNLEDTFELIKMYGEIFQVKTEASSVIQNIQNERHNFQEYIQNKPKIKSAYFIWKTPWMVTASDTFINVMLSEAGFENVFQYEKRYPEIDLEHINLKNAEVILLSSEPYPFKQKHIEEFKAKFPSKQVLVVDGELFSWYGSRLQKSYAYFKELHNEL